MPNYAQTNLVLFRQLAEGGFGAQDVLRVRNAYALAMRLFSGRYRPSGKTFMAHVVGVASILAAHGQGVDMLCAGLLHSAYSEGDFGNCAARGAARRRRVIVAGAGTEVERLVYAYTYLRWNERNIGALHARRDTLDEQLRCVVMLRLANELEDHLDLAALHVADAVAQRRRASSLAPLLAELATRIGTTELGRELTAALAHTATAALSPELEASQPYTRSYLLPPASYRRRSVLALCAALRLLARGIIRPLRHRRAGVDPAAASHPRAGLE